MLAIYPFLAIRRRGGSGFVTIMSIIILKRKKKSCYSSNYFFSILHFHIVVDLANKQWAHEKNSHSQLFLYNNTLKSEFGYAIKCDEINPYSPHTYQINYDMKSNSNKLSN